LRVPKFLDGLCPNDSFSIQEDKGNTKHDDFRALAVIERGQCCYQDRQLKNSTLHENVKQGAQSTEPILAVHLKKTGNLAEVFGVNETK
jgi:hypothetical protein